MVDRACWHQWEESKLYIGWKWTCSVCRVEVTSESSHRLIADLWGKDD